MHSSHYLSASLRGQIGLGHQAELVPWIDCQNLRAALQSSSSTSSKRRHSSSSSSSPPSKRRELQDGAVANTGFDPSAAIVASVFRHQFELHYAKARPTDASDDPALSQEVDPDQDDSHAKALLEYLSDLCAGAGEPVTFEIGQVDVGYSGEAGAGISFKDEGHIAILPPIFTNPNHARSHLFTWVDSLGDQTICPVELVGSLRVVAQPPDTWEEGAEDLPFHLIVDVTLNFLAPAIFEPIPKVRAGRRVDTEESLRSLLNLAFPPPPPPQAFRSGTDMPFFYSTLQPAPALQSRTVQEVLQPPALIPTLLPFQRRSVSWMLQREGKKLDPSGKIVPTPIDLEALPLFWERIVVEQEGGCSLTWYYNRLTASVTSERPQEEAFALGGILAEEPGLGKTLECIALVLLNPGIGRNPSRKRWDPEAKVDVREIKTTLIVTPGSLSQQWIDELALHAPSLKVFVYEGWSKLPVPITKQIANAKRIPSQEAKSKMGKAKVIVLDGLDEDFPQEDDPMDVESENSEDWCSFVNTFDVCITTYNVLQQDLNVARAPPIRPRREVAEYSKTQRPRSPLIMCEWYRVIMDEVQMVGGGKTSEMVSLIPRLSSFAVSGTPVRAQVSDLSHILKFLRVSPILYSPRIWSRLQTRQLASEFAALFQRYAVRTTKAAVTAELTIPQQSRYLVPIALGRVEQLVYDQNLEKALLELGLDARGVAASENWEIDTGLLRTWLRKLRQICTHPQVGHLSLMNNKTGGLKTMAQVLEGMKDQNWRNLMDNRRTKVNELAEAAQLTQHDKSKDARHRKALDILLEAEKEANQLVDDIQVVIADHDAKGEEMKKAAAALRESRGQPTYPKPLAIDGADKGKGKVVEREMSLLSDSDDGSEDGGLPKTPAGEEHKNKKRALQQRLREVFVTLHRVKFLQGDAYHTLGQSHAVEEEGAYAAAESLRRKLLKITEESAKRAMAQLAKDGKKGYTEKEIVVEVPYCPGGGIRSELLMEEADAIIDEVMNEQSKLLWKWRQHIYGLLTRPLTSNDSEADGEEYNRTLETQGEAETYLQAYAMLLADRREILLAERTALAVYDAREKKLRKTKAALKAAAFPDPDKFDLQLLDEDIELQPEHEALKMDLAAARKTILEHSDGRAIKSVMVDLTAVVAKIVGDQDPEKVLAKEGAASLRRLITAQANINEKLDTDLGLFRRAFNERILYFRQLQEISDSVVEPEWDNDVSVAIDVNRAARNGLDTEINTGRARQRYLDHLATTQGRDDDQEEEGCILCKCEFTRGYITQCAHVFCEDCMKSWLSRHNKACPVCRVPINMDTLQRFSVQDKNRSKPAAARIMPERLKDEHVPRSRRKIEYNIIHSDLEEEMNSMESHGSYGSKIQTLVRHLLYLQLSDTGAKSIVFSAWADSLHIIQHALTMNGISSLRIDSGTRKQDAAKKFRTDPGIIVLLLHGERENAGLNVTCASRVFLLESVVHHSFEIQAIARIDRLGQSKPTEVYCYYAEDTVERNILDLAARQGLSLYTKDTSHGTLNTSSFAPASEKTVVDSPSKKKQKGDFIAKLDDMMSILFPHLTEDIEFLLPPVEAEPQADASDARPSTPVRPRAISNAIAGPSRLA